MAWPLVVSSHGATGPASPRLPCFCFAARHPQRRPPPGIPGRRSGAPCLCPRCSSRDVPMESACGIARARCANGEKSAPRADRAVALHSAGQLAVRPESVSSEVTSITVTNVSPPDFGAPAGVCLIHEASFVVHEVVQVPAGARQSLTASGRSHDLLHVWHAALSRSSSA